MDYDVLVVGGGIAGMESAITLGDMGYSVLVVEKKPSIGGGHDPPEQGLSHPRLRKLYRHAENGCYFTPSQRNNDGVCRSRRFRQNRRRRRSLPFPGSDLA